MIKLYIFDADGTLIEQEARPLSDRGPGLYKANVLKVLSSLGTGVKFAIATNQGGPACHDAGWPFSENFPDYLTVADRYRALAKDISAKLYMSLAYETNSGNWLYPKDCDPKDPRIDHGWRKPAPGMLLQAMSDFGVTPDETIFVGDGVEDSLAAQAANCRFIWAGKFFDWTEKGKGQKNE